MGIHPPVPAPAQDMQGVCGGAVRVWCATGGGLGRGGGGGGEAGQGAGVGELLAAFDAVHAAHAAMQPDEFNNDGTYQGGINTVRARVRVP
jgi:hypothetical protein